MGWFGWITGDRTSSPEVGEIFKLDLGQTDFVSIDVQNIYTRILVDVLERTDGIPDEKIKLLWDNCLKSESTDGLVTLMAKAMATQAELFLVYDKATEVVRKATTEEQNKIRDGYAKKSEAVSLDGKTGVYITFRNNDKTKMVRLYSALEYCTVGALYKQTNLSKATQIKLSELRSSTGLSDSADVKAQTVAIANALREGKDVGLDAKDILEMLKPDLTATNSAMDFIAQKQSFYLGLPASYFKGSNNTSALSDTGKSDSKATERGLRPYYFSIIKPVIEQLFGSKTTFKSDDFEMLGTANETLKTFELTSNEFIGQDNKRGILNKLFGLPADAKGDAPQKPDPNDPNAVPPKPGAPPDPQKPPGAKPPA